MPEYDLFVIGGGSGGVRAARVAAHMGHSVAVAEEFRFGGTCVIRGCVPKKLFVYAAAAGEQVRTSRAFGWSAQSPAFDWHVLREAKDNEITRLEGLYRKGIDGAGAHIIDDRAVLLGHGRVRLVGQDRVVTAKHILITTGATPTRLPDLPGAALCITSDEVFDLPDLPKRAVIVGGGYIAVEFAGILNGLGVDTTLVYRGDKVLRGFDEHIRDGLMTAMAAKGVRLIMNAHPRAVSEDPETGKSVRLSTGQTLQTDLVMLAVGRTANTRDLGLGEAGVDCAQDGRIMVDEYGQTTAQGVHALGDVTNREQLTPVAIHEAMCWVDTVFKGAPKVPDRSNIATAVFSQPEIGCIGLTEIEAQSAFDCVDVFHTSFRPMKSTLSGDPTPMIMKLVVDGTSDRVLGAHIMGEGAGEMIQLIAVAFESGVTKAHFDATMAVHPTAAEELVTHYVPTRSHGSTRNLGRRMQ